MICAISFRFFEMCIRDRLCTNQLTYKTVRDLRVQTFHKLNAVPLRYIDGHSHGDIISRVVTDIDLISDGLLQGFTQLFTGVVTILAVSYTHLGFAYNHVGARFIDIEYHASKAQDLLAQGFQQFFLMGKPSAV